MADPTQPRTLVDDELSWVFKLGLHFCGALHCASVFGSLFQSCFFSCCCYGSLVVDSGQQAEKKLASLPEVELTPETSYKSVLIESLCSIWRPAQCVVQGLSFYLAHPTASVPGNQLKISRRNSFLRIAHTAFFTLE